MRHDARISDWRSLKPAGSPPRRRPGSDIGHSIPRPGGQGRFLPLDRFVYISAVEHARVLDIKGPNMREYTAGIKAEAETGYWD